MKKLKLKALELGVQEVLTRDQLKNVLGGDGSNDGTHVCYSTTTTCTYQESGTGTVSGSCSTNANGKCVCSNGTSSVLSSDCVKSN